MVHVIIMPVGPGGFAAMLSGSGEPRRTGPTNAKEGAVDGVKRELAKVTSADICEMYNGMLGLSVGFKYESGFSQNLSGYVLDAAMVIRVMAAIGVLSLSEAVGKSCWVTHTHSSVIKIEPLHKDDGKPFVLAEWQKFVEKKMPGLSYRDLLGE